MNKWKCNTHSHRSNFNGLFRLTFAAASAFVLLSMAAPAHAVKLSAPGAEDTFIDLRLLTQPWIQLNYQDVADPGRDFRPDFYLRRTRILLGGQLTKLISFFVETDMPNWGKGGSWSGSNFLVQDAYVSFDIHESFKLATGMLILPFVHQSLQSAANLNTLDYHGALIKYPANSTSTWRGAGLGARGLVANKKLDYRLTITRGNAHGSTVIDAKTDATGTVTTPAVVSDTKDIPRFTGRIAFNAFDAEEGFFLGGTYLGQKKILSVGAAFDVQPGVFGEDNAYYGFGGDVFLDLPLANNRRLSGQLDVVYYGGEANPNKGIGMLFDIGFGIGKWQPVLVLDWFKYDIDGGDFTTANYFGVHGGVNYYLLGHGANVKLDIGWIKDKGFEMDKGALVTTIQTQLLF